MFTSRMMQHIHHRGKVFYCPIKSNRNISTDKGRQYLYAKELKWNQKQQEEGLYCQLKGLDNHIKVKAFQVVCSTTQKEIVITNDAVLLSSVVVQEVVSHRWEVE